MKRIGALAAVLAAAACALASPEDSRRVTSVETSSESSAACERSWVGPDGAIYFTTSNRDGRGRIRKGDDRIPEVTRQ